MFVSSEHLVFSPRCFSDNDNLKEMYWNSSRAYKITFSLLYSTNWPPFALIFENLIYLWLYNFLFNVTFILPGSLSAFAKDVQLPFVNLSQLLLVLLNSALSVRRWYGFQFLKEFNILWKVVIIHSVLFFCSFAALWLIFIEKFSDQTVTILSSVRQVNKF